MPKLMKEKRFFWAFPILTGALALHAAVLTPNPNSLLPGKRVLILDGTSTSHAATRTAAFAKIQAIQTAVGFTMTHLTAVTSVTTAYLNNYDIVLFDYFFETQLTTATFQTAIKTWLASGNKGYIGSHTSAANEAGEGDWYRDRVTSRR